MGIILITLLRTVGQMILAIILSPLMIKRAIESALNYAKSKLSPSSTVTPMIDQAEKILDEAIPDDGSKANLPPLPEKK